MASTTDRPTLPETLGLLFNDTGVRYELLDGVLRAKPVGSIFHGMIISSLNHLLEMQIGDERIVVTDPHSKIDERNWLRPDIAVLNSEDAEPWKYIQPGHWPRLCIEVQSPPDQNTDDLLEKCQTFHQQGVPYCWIIDPESRNAWEYHKGHGPKWLRHSELLTAGTIQIGLDDLWKRLKDVSGLTACR